ncbi:VOC family protein [Amycolatopsis ultiminotia]|uniref:VOC family protein n=1 Tax=Amycolatopsis ultiminotia TaxID=543629 RepID=A0ABP6WKA7_9PSEU
MSGDAGAVKARAVFQVGYVVPDLEAARDYLETTFGIGPWLTIDKPAIDERRYRGTLTPQAYEAVAFAFVGDLQIELMQPVVGPSAFEEFLNGNPNGGFHRLAMLVDDYDSAVKAMGGQERVKQSGRVNDFRFAFFEAPPLGGMVEIVQLDDDARQMLANFRNANQ